MAKKIFFSNVCVQEGKYKYVVDVCTLCTGRVCDFINLYVGLFEKFTFHVVKYVFDVESRGCHCSKSPVMILIMHRETHI